MKLHDFIGITNARVSGEIERAELVPTDKSEMCGSNSILFIYRKLDGQYSTSPENIPSDLTAVVCDADYPIPQIGLVLRVNDVRMAYSYAHYLHNGLDTSKMRLIAVTGTNGKTTTATLIHEILQYSGIKCGFIGTGKIMIGTEDITENNYSMTTPDPALLYRALGEMERFGCEAAVMEVSSHSIALG